MEGLLYHIITIIGNQGAFHDQEIILPAPEQIPLDSYRCGEKTLISVHLLQSHVAIIVTADRPPH